MKINIKPKKRDKTNLNKCLNRQRINDKKFKILEDKKYYAYLMELGINYTTA